MPEGPRQSSQSEPFQKRLIAVEPWTASGPGWANAGVRAHFEVTTFEQRGKSMHQVTRVETEYLYTKDMTVEEHAVFQIALLATEPFRRRFLGKEEGPHVRAR